MLTDGPTMISCPACAGVVQAVTGPHRHVEMRCSVGHAFSLEELYMAKEDQLEHAQWSLIALMKHLQMIMQVDAASEGHDRVHFDTPAFHERWDQLARHIAAVEHLIHETRLPSTRDAIDGNERVAHEAR